MYRTQYDTPRANAFLSVVLGILMTVFSCSFILLLALRFENAASIIRNTDVAWVLEETGISDDIIGQINDLPFIETDIDIDDVEEFLKSDAVSGELGKVLDDYAKAYAEGNLDYHITPDEITDIARTLEPELNDMFDRQLTESDYAIITRTLDDAVDFRELSVGNIIDEMDIDTTIPFLFVSSYLLWGACILCVVTLLIIFLHHRNRITDAFLSGGIPVMLSGLIALIAGALFRSSPELYGDTLHSVAKFLGGPAYLVMMYGLAFAAIGVLFIAIYFVLNFFKTVDRQNKNRRASNRYLH